MQEKPFWFEAMSNEEASRWRRPWVTILVVGSCAILFGLQFLFPGIPVYEPFYFTMPDRWFEYYRLVTPIFLHFSVLHIAFNTAIFWFFGRQIETLLGSWALGALVLISGLASNMAQYFAQGPQFGGLSGVVMAVISFAWMAVTFGRVRAFMPQGLLLFALVSLLLGFFGILDRFLGPIANTAHTVGFISGVFLWPVIAMTRPLDRT